MKINIIKIGVYLLLITSFLRPIVTVLEGKTPIPFHQIVPATLVYLMLLLLIISMRRIKLDAIQFCMFLFSVYAIISSLWGSQFKSIPELILPFVGYIAARYFAQDLKSVIMIFVSLLAGYLIPIIGSAILIFYDLSVSYIVYGSGAIRQHGMYNGFHQAAHSLVLFSYIYSFFLVNEISISKAYRYSSHGLFIISIYCLWNTYVRSGILSIIIFWGNFLFRWNKKVALSICMLVVCLCIWKISSIESIFWKADTWDREKNIETASSGRTEIWAHNLEIFMNSPLYTKILGNGLGNEAEFFVQKEDVIWSAHNDYLSILMLLGLAGLLIYLSIYFLLLIKIINSKKNLIQSMLLSMIVASLFTSMITNGYTFRFEAHQTFWIIVGCAQNLLGESKRKFNCL